MGMNARKMVYAQANRSERTQPVSPHIKDTTGDTLKVP